MAKTLKLALSALAFAQAHKPRADVEQAFDRFLKDFDKSYDDVEKQADWRKVFSCLFSFLFFFFFGLFGI